MRGEKVLKTAGWVVLGVAGATAIGALLGLAVMALWNWLMPGIFGLPEITYLQAVGLFVLAHLLLKGHTGHSHTGHGHEHVSRFKWRIRKGLRAHDNDADGDEAEPVR